MMITMILLLALASSVLEDGVESPREALCSLTVAVGNLRMLRPLYLVAVAAASVVIVFVVVVVDCC